MGRVTKREKEIVFHLMVTLPNGFIVERTSRVEICDVEAFGHKLYKWMLDGMVFEIENQISRSIYTP